MINKYFIFHKLNPEAPKRRKETDWFWDEGWKSKMSFCVKQLERRAFNGTFSINYFRLLNVGYYGKKGGTDGEGKNCPDYCKGQKNNL